jgi:hypothetical protein
MGCTDSIHKRRQYITNLVENMNVTGHLTDLNIRKSEFLPVRLLVETAVVAQICSVLTSALDDWTASTTPLSHYNGERASEPSGGGWVGQTAGLNGF